MPKLGDRLKELRGALSIYEVGKELGINRGHLQRYEAGSLLPTPEKLYRIAEYFDIPYKELWFLYFEEVHPSEEEQALILEWAAKRIGQNYKGS